MSSSVEATRSRVRDMLCHTCIVDPDVEPSRFGRHGGEPAEFLVARDILLNDFTAELAVRQRSAVSSAPRALVR
jgi:hypothetical protein